MAPDHRVRRHGRLRIRRSEERLRSTGDRFRETFSAPATTHIRLVTESVEQSGDLAYEIGRYEITVLAPGEQPAVADQGKYLVVWQFQSERWEAMADMFNSSVPVGRK